ncbi:tetratricopeptide repeat-containing sensor histidine kinase [Chitinophaga alhagiae]|uniref:tetratricopeptide repeat-containing sensor histidine kinase n=1 Tax=Chitinophaga alhagiae TaxID=2203219 RepID=UPI000E5B74A6|nr:ATP-binding protein [Chitinophaga alhagiae]
MRKWFAIMVLCCLWFLAGAQSPKTNGGLLSGLPELDRKIKQIRKSPLDTAHVSQLKDLGYDLLETDSAVSRQLLEEALAKSLQVKENNTIASCYRLLGLWHHFFSEPDKTLHNYYLSMKYAAASKNLYLYGGICYNIGNVKYYLGEYDSCIYYYTKARDAFDDPRVLAAPAVTEKLLDRRKSDLYSNFSAVFNSLGNLPKAEEYIDKAIAINKKYDSPAAADALAYYMQQKADNFHEQGFIEKALRVRLAFLPQMEKGKGTRESVQNSYQNISKEYFLLQKIDSAKVFAHKSLQLAAGINSVSGTAHANKQLGVISMHQQHYDEAEKYMKIAKPYYENSKDILEKRSFYEVMYQLNDKLGSYKDALAYAEKLIAVNDSVLVGEKAKQFAELEARYESQKKQSQIELQQEQIKQKNAVNYILIGGTAALAIIFLLGFRNYRQQQKLQQKIIEELETEKQLATAQSILKGEEQERTRLAKDLHDGLGGMLSGIKYSFQNMKENLILTPENAQAFERSIDMLDSSIKEMRRVAHNMMPEMLVRYGLDVALKEFCNEIDRSGAVKATYQSMGVGNMAVEQTVAVTVYRIIQELVHNAVKHANAQNLLVQVHASEQGKMLSVTVEDDGKGFDTALLQNVQGMGWSNIQNRVDFLKGKIDVHSAPLKGTSVLMEIPLS